jgi:hypothetical protein
MTGEVCFTVAKFAPREVGNIGEVGTPAARCARFFLHTKQQEMVNIIVAIVMNTKIIRGGTMNWIPVVIKCMYLSIFTLYIR